MGLHHLTLYRVNYFSGNFDGDSLNFTDLQKFLLNFILVTIKYIDSHFCSCLTQFISSPNLYLIPVVFQSIHCFYFNCYFHLQNPGPIDLNLLLYSLIIFLSQASN